MQFEAGMNILEFEVKRSKNTNTNTEYKLVKTKKTTVPDRRDERVQIQVCKKPNRFLSHAAEKSVWYMLLLGGELLAERCRTDDLLPSIPISCLPPFCMDPKVLRLNILINCSQPGHQVVRG